MTRGGAAAEPGSPHPDPSWAQLFADRLLSSFVARGVRDVVVCPGSRSQALALGAVEAERRGALRVHVRIDERSAGFFALGMARETGVPVPVIVTSGTAVANLAPAVLEAHEGRVPLVLLTADRPAELRGVRSNQTTRQGQLFASVARAVLEVAAPESPAASGPYDPVADPEALAARAWSASRGREGGDPAGPVHLNLAFREPLSGPHEEAAPAAHAESGAEDVPRDSDVADATDDAVRPETLGELTDGDGVVVIAGQDAGAAAADFARDAGLPLLAEVVSGARFGREAIAHYAALLDEAEREGSITGAIVFGHPTLTRQVSRLMLRLGAAATVVDPHRGPGVEHYDPAHRARVVTGVRLATGADPAAWRAWLGRWVVADRRLRERAAPAAPTGAERDGSDAKRLSALARSTVAHLRAPVTRDALVDRVWRATWPHDRLVLAASRLVRVLDARAAPRRVVVHANRGLAGIDGTIATALGVALASQQAESPRASVSVTRLLIGDLAALHDVGSLLLPDTEVRPRLQVFVGNDRGGTIFDTLEAARTADAAAFERVMRTPQSVDFAAVAGAYGWGFRRVRSRGELDEACLAPVNGVELVEVELAVGDPSAAESD